MELTLGFITTPSIHLTEFAKNKKRNPPFRLLTTVHLLYGIFIYFKQIQWQNLKTLKAIQLLKSKTQIPKNPIRNFLFWTNSVFSNDKAFPKERTMTSIVLSDEVLLKAKGLSTSIGNERLYFKNYSLNKKLFEWKDFSGGGGGGATVKLLGMK